MGEALPENWGVQSEISRWSHKPGLIGTLLAKNGVIQIRRSLGFLCSAQTSPKCISSPKRNGEPQNQITQTKRRGP